MYSNWSNCTPNKCVSMFCKLIRLKKMIFSSLLLTKYYLLNYPSTVKTVFFLYLGFNHKSVCINLVESTA